MQIRAVLWWYVIYNNTDQHVGASTAQLYRTIYRIGENSSVDTDATARLGVRNNNNVLVTTTDSIDRNQP